MDRYHYHRLIRRLEANSVANPPLFLARVLIVTGIPYLILFGMLATTARLLYSGIADAIAGDLAGVLVSLVLFAIIAPVFFVVLRILFMPLSPPEGRHLTPTEAPKLFGALDRISKTLNGPPIHHVLINESYSARICQRPRWGLFGQSTNYLTVGLPYMLALAPKEMHAAIAHEYAHLSGSHGKIGAWVYRQRLTFGALYSQVLATEADNWLHTIMAHMLRFFTPYYNAHTFVLAHENEYEADRTATEVAGATANVRRLIRDALQGRWIAEEFWPKLFAQADTQLKPAFLPFNSMRTAFKASHAQWATKERLYAAWAERSGLDDTHPAVRDRVEAIGEDGALPPCTEVTAADALLGTSIKVLIDEFDRGWWEREKTAWKARHRQVIKSRGRLSELSRVPIEKMTIKDFHERTMLSVRHESPQAARLLLERLLAQPGGAFPDAAYHYGRMLLDDGVDSGLDHLMAAAHADRHLAEPAAQAGYAYLLARHDEEVAQHWWTDALSRHQQAAA